MRLLTAAPAPAQSQPRAAHLGAQAQPREAGGWPRRAVPRARTVGEVHVVAHVPSARALVHHLGSVCARAGRRGSRAEAAAGAGVCFGRARYWLSNDPRADTRMPTSKIWKGRKGWRRPRCRGRQAAHLLLPRLLYNHQLGRLRR